MSGAVAQFGLVIAGRPVLTDFVCVSRHFGSSQGERKFGALADCGRRVCEHHREIGPAHYTLSIGDPTAVTDLTFFLLPNSPVPPGFGGACCYADRALWLALNCRD